MSDESKALERIARVEENQRWVMQNLTDIRNMLEKSLSEKGEAHERILERLNNAEDDISGIKAKLWMFGIGAGAILTALWELVKAKLWGDHP